MRDAQAINLLTFSLANFLTSFIALGKHFFKNSVYFTYFGGGEALEALFEGIFAATKPFAKAFDVGVLGVGFVAPAEFVA